MKNWYLVGYQPGKKDLARTNINTSPFKVGRQDKLSFSVPSSNASRVHAEFNQRGEQLFVKDFGSTNGTFVNHKRIQQETEVLHGDIIHFADYEMRIMSQETAVPAQSAMQNTVFRPSMSLSEQLPSGVRELEELLRQRNIQTLFQPIVAADTKTLVAYEVLGRGAHDKLEKTPDKLFHIAESFDLAIELSECFRECGLECADMVSPHRYFLNIHPLELNDEARFLNSMYQLRRSHGTLPLVLEIHEKAVTNLEQMKRLKSELKNMTIELAYDDFGAGQGRLMELIEDPPDYLKFDIALVKDIDKAPEVKVQMVSLFVELAKKMGITTLAECVETAGEVEVCKNLGFDLFQGYYISKPQMQPNFHNIQQSISLSASR
ncbi:MAG: EAL domain-containing protein [Pseudomonadales bacterium]|nr:EAL domain-containing protein [Pseudomonadales bacterium]